MPFIVYDFSKPRRTRRPSSNQVAIGYRRTIVGWYNLRLIGSDDGTVVNVSPQEFAAIFPNVRADVVSGTAYLSVSRAEEIGFVFATEEVGIA